MNVVLIIQAGDDGPLRIVPATDKSLVRVVARLQDGSVPLLHVRATLDGDERLQLRLRRDLHAHRGERDWYAAEALEAIDDDIGRLELHDEARRVALVELRGMA